MLQTLFITMCITMRLRYAVSLLSVKRESFTTMCVSTSFITMRNQALFKFSEAITML